VNDCWKRLLYQLKSSIGVEYGASVRSVLLENPKLQNAEVFQI